MSFAIATMPPPNAPAPAPANPPTNAPTGQAFPMATPAAIAPPTAPTSIPARTVFPGSRPLRPPRTSTMRTSPRAKVSTVAVCPCRSFARTFKRNVVPSAESNRPTYSCPLHNSIRRGESHLICSTSDQSAEVFAHNADAATKLNRPTADIRQIRIGTSNCEPYAGESNRGVTSRTLSKVSHPWPSVSPHPRGRCSTPNFAILTRGCAL